MTVQFIIGRSGSGKTSWCLEQIVSELRRQPQGPPLIMLVPEQATFQAEYELVSTPGLKGMIRAQVLSFRRLAYRVLLETGGAGLTQLDETGKKMLIYTIMHRMRDELPAFAPSAELTGFIEHVQTFFDELKRYVIPSSELAAHVRKLEPRWRETRPAFADKMNDLQRVYAAYEKEMNRRYLDTEDVLSLLAEQMHRSDWLSEASIWIDGFNGFTPQEMSVVLELMRVAKQTRITLCLDRPYAPDERPHELDLFYQPARTMGELRSALRDAGISEQEPLVLPEPAQIRFADSPALARLESNLAYGYAYPQSGADHDQVPDSAHPAIRIVQTPDRTGEVEAAAREMIRLVRDEGYRWKDIAVLVRSMADYDELMKGVFADYGIPCFFDAKRSVTHHPLIEFVRSALDVVLFHWRYDDVFRCAKTELLFDLDKPDDEQRDAMARLENEVLAHGIQGGRWHDDKLWERIITVMSRNGVNDSDPDQQLERMKLEQIQEARRRITKPLHSFQKRIQKARVVTDWVRALYELLEDVDARGRLQRWIAEQVEAGMPEAANMHGQMWDRVIDVFDNMVEIMGEESVAPELFAGMLETGLKSIRIGLVPPSLDQVLVGSMDRTRSGSVRCSLVIGASDGVLPQRGTEDGVLTEPEREVLASTGIELAPGSRRRLLDEQFLIYRALASPAEKLWISYPLADEEGKSMKPSEVIRKLKRIFPRLEVDSVLQQGSPGLQEQQEWPFITRPDRTVSELIVQLRHWKNGTAISPLWLDAYHWYVTNERWQENIRLRMYGLFYTNREQRLSPKTSRELYGDPLLTSVSRMETFVACPFAQYAAYGLRLSERKVYRLQAPDIGRLFHAALNMIALELQQERIGWGELTAAECEQRAERVVDRLAPELQIEILQSSKRYAYIARKLKQIIARAAAVLGEHARRGRFQPIGLEVDFGSGAAIPPLSFDLNDGRRMEVRGRIDRVDLAEDGDRTWLRVIDYKSSQTSLGLSEVFYGLSLQMLTYLDVVITHAETWIGKEASPAGVLYFHVHNPLIQHKHRLTREQAEREWFRRFKMKGWLLSDPEVVKMMDQSLDKGHSDIVPAGLKAGGDFYKHSSVVDNVGWDQLRKHTRRQIRRIGNEIAAGEVQANPYRIGGRTPCEYCPYQAVCQFDPAYEGNDYRTLHTLGEEEIWQAMQQQGRSEAE